MGSGRMEEDEYTHMVVASFLQKNTQYVSLLTGGYGSIHNYFGDHIGDCLEKHDPKMCLICFKNQPKGKIAQQSNKRPTETGTTTDLFAKFSSVMKLKLAEVKDKLMHIIVNPSNNTANASMTVGNSHQYTQERHVSASERNGKHYRNVAPAFSIDDGIYMAYVLYFMKKMK
ncbi:TBC1 domain family member 23-like [Glossina fuscipes]|uniref:TBC1 domain family member 23-like n=1 Tax=Glossina fuscipes TaxID=7396 RepID=A0A9C5ZMF3_9MUSC|nr:TBC1 domain family member 23-like [Glossina fuscipes]